MSFGIWSFIGGIIGWFVTRSIWGGLMGSFVGSLFDNTTNTSSSQARGRTSRKNFTQRTEYDRDFSSVLLVLTAAMMKADGNALKSELNFVKSFFVTQFGEEIALKHIEKLRDYLDKNIDPLRTTTYIRDSFSNSEKIQLLHYLTGIAYADGDLASPEYQLLVNMAVGMGLNKITVDSIIAMFNYRGNERSQYQDQPRNFNSDSQLENAFKILGVEKSSDESKIKKAYRKLVVEHHPDKVTHLGEEHVESAKVKFQKIQEAYEIVKNHKGIK